MTADRIIESVVMIAGFVALMIYNRRKLARMTPAERTQWDRNIAPFARFMKAFMWFWAVAVAAAGVLAAVDGVWTISIALLGLAAGIAFGLTYHSRWWAGS